MMRQAISKKTRFDVFKRDGFKCAYCGATPSESVVLEVDHIHPVADGGTNEINNLVTACWDCNRGKGPRLLSSVPQSLEEKATVLPSKKLRYGHSMRFSSFERSERTWKRGP